MSIYTGLDVSNKTAHICVVDGDGRCCGEMLSPVIVMFWPSG